MPRDPERIGPIVERLLTYWQAHPDLRLTQIICNAVDPVVETMEALYYIEDEEVVEGIDHLDELEQDTW